MPEKSKPQTLEEMKRAWHLRHGDLNAAEAIMSFVMFMMSQQRVDLSAEAQQFIQLNSLGNLRPGWVNMCEFKAS